MTCDRLEEPVLVASEGLDVAEHPQPDFMKIAPEEIPGYLVSDMKTILQYLPQGPDASIARAHPDPDIADVG